MADTDDKKRIDTEDTDTKKSDIHEDSVGENDVSGNKSYTEDVGHNNDTPSSSKSKKIKPVLIFAFAVLCLIVYIIANNTVISSWFVWIFDILKPLTVGAAIAYIVNPILRFFEYIVFKRMKRRKLRRTVSMFCTYVLVVLIIFLLVLMVFPELSGALSDLTQKFSEYVENAVSIVNNTINAILGTSKQYIDPDQINKLVNGFINDMSNLSEFFETYGGNVIFAFRSIYNVFYNLFFGLIISFYILATKEKRIAQIKKFFRAVLSDKKYESVISAGNIANRCFGGFIKGKLLDSLIIGLLSYVIMLIFGIPYPIILATCVGATNVIPIFGPFIGAIIGGVIVFFVKPDSLILFIILVIIIQQIDGNLIGPKILGSSTGISSLGVISAIIIFGGLFGLAGMIIGVPLLAVIIEIVKNIINDRLNRKGYPSRTGYYYPDDSIVRAIDDREDTLHKKMAINRAIDSLWAKLKKRFKSKKSEKNKNNKK